MLYLSINIKDYGLVKLSVRGLSFSKISMCSTLDDENMLSDCIICTRV